MIKTNHELKNPAKNNPALAFLTMPEEEKDTPKTEELGAKASSGEPVKDEAPESETVEDKTVEDESAPEEVRPENAAPTQSAAPTGQEVKLAMNLEPLAVRPKIEPYSKRLQVLMQPSVYSALYNESVNKGLSVNKLLNQIVKDYFKDRDQK